ncbi:MAG: 30S ribosomal protein S9 [Alphaproteobacteria bacterium]|nr:30S ribosomal protein S9 [Alphaproteobacteria bacterium]
MNNSIQVYSSIGKRKTSVAKIFLKKGSGKIIVNQKEFKDFFSSVSEECEQIKKPLILIDQNNKYDIDIIVRGGGISSQMEAIKLALAKSICQISNEYRQILSQNTLLRRDARIKERRKYGLKKARKASQYSKR